VITPGAYHNCNPDPKYDEHGRPQPTAGVFNCDSEDDYDAVHCVCSGAGESEVTWTPFYDDCSGPPGRLSALSVFLCKSVFYGAFVWACRALNSRKRRFPARAGLNGTVYRHLQVRTSQGWAE
jgi:hypothetical protein